MFVLFDWVWGWKLVFWFMYVWGMWGLCEFGFVKQLMATTIRYYWVITLRCQRGIFAFPRHHWSLFL
jgi:hypothetical protein